MLVLGELVGGFGPLEREMGANAWCRSMLH